jgi:hypothetical protein
MSQFGNEVAATHDRPSAGRGRLPLQARSIWAMLAGALLVTIGFGTPAASAETPVKLLPKAKYYWDGCFPKATSCPSATVDMFTNKRGKISNWSFYSLMRAPSECRDGAWSRWEWDPNKPGNEPQIRVRKNGTIRYQTGNRDGKFRLAAKVSKDGKRIKGNFSSKYRIENYPVTCTSKIVHFVARTAKKP